MTEQEKFEAKLSEAFHLMHSYVLYYGVGMTIDYVAHPTEGGV